MKLISKLIRKTNKLVFVRRLETKNKWWHRLALVLIYGSIIFGAIYFGIFIISEENETWFYTTYTAYSFENGYQAADGLEMDCEFSAYPNDNLPFTIFRCGDFISNNSEFLNKYNNALGTYENLQNLRQQKSFSDLNEIEPTRNYSGERTRVRAQERTEGKMSIEDVDAMLMVELIEGGQLNDVKVKHISSFDYTLFFTHLGMYLFLIFLWLIFWESIIYRTILFVVYGKEKQ